VLNRRPRVLSAAPRASGGQRAHSLQRRPSHQSRQSSPRPGRPSIHAPRRSRQSQRRVMETRPCSCGLKRKYASRYLDLDIYHSVVALPVQSTTSSYLLASTTTVVATTPAPARLVSCLCLLARSLARSLIVHHLRRVPSNTDRRISPHPYPSRSLSLTHARPSPQLQTTGLRQSCTPPPPGCTA
jgi:hypothetical protein